MDPKKIDLEVAYKFYLSIKDKAKLTKTDCVQLKQFENECRFIRDKGKLGKQGTKSAAYIFEKLRQLATKHAEKIKQDTSEIIFHTPFK